MTLILFALLCGAADRLFGAAEPAFKGKKAVIALSLLAFGYLLGGPMGAALGGIFFVNRTLDPRIFGGDFTPTGNERQGAFLRYATVIPFALVAAYMTHHDLIKTGIAMTVWALVATLISSWYGEEEAKAKARNENLDDSLNVAVEFGRGAAFGVLAGLV